MVTDLPAAPLIGTLPDAPGTSIGAPELSSRQDNVRDKLLKIYEAQGVPFLEDLLKDGSKASERLKFDAVKLIQQGALPAPQAVLGDVNIAIVVDL